MGKKLTETQWLLVLSDRHRKAQVTRRPACRDTWQRAWNSVPRHCWLIERAMGKSPAQAYNEWAAARVLQSVSAKGEW